MSSGYLWWCRFRQELCAHNAIITFTVAVLSIHLVNSGCDGMYDAVVTISKYVQGNPGMYTVCTDVTRAVIPHHLRVFAGIIYDLLIFIGSC